MAAPTRTAGPSANRDTSGTSTFSEVGAITTTSGGNRSVYLGLNFNRSTNPGATISSVTLGGAAMTAVTTLAENTTLNPREATIFYKLENHSLGAGAMTLAVNFSAFVDSIAWCLWEYSGTSAPVADKFNATTGAGANASLSLTAVAVNAAILSMHAANADPTAGSGFTLVDVPNLAWFTSAEYNDDAGSSGDKTVGYTHSSGDWVMSAMSLIDPGGGTPGNASGDIATVTASTPDGTASTTRAVTVTLKNNSGSPLVSVSRRFWTRNSLNGAAADGGAGGLAVTCDGAGVFALTGLAVLAGAGWLTYKDPADDLNCHTVPVTFI